MAEQNSEIVIDNNNFELVTGSDKPVLVDFYATWCGPCQMMLPVIKEIATEEKNKTFIVAILDLDANAEIAAKYDVMSVPTFIIFKDGKEQARMLGAMPKDAILTKIKEVIGS